MYRAIEYFRSLFDVRKGERLRTLLMSFYLLFVLAAYYILRPVSRALFLTRFDIDKLPWLYILIAAAGGLFAYLYTLLALRSSLRVAVTWTMGSAVASLILFREILASPQPWMLYVFEIFVKVLSIVLVSQGWLVAANLFSTREAKRVYGLLGISSVAGATVGGAFTAATVKTIGILNLVFASAATLIIAYVCFRLAIAQEGSALASTVKAETEEEPFSFAEMVGNIRQSRHLQVIIGIITMTYIVDVMVEYQWNAMARESFTDEKSLAAYLGAFQGVYTNVATVFLFLITSAVVRRFGVGGALQVMPVTLAAGSIATAFSPTMLATSASRLMEAAMRYSFNRTGMELLYVPLPVDLKNRTKGFVDVFVDRLARGIGGMLLILLTTILGFGIREIALSVFAFTLASIWLINYARKEYVATVRSRIAVRRLDLANARVSLDDRGTVKALEAALESEYPGQITYALSLLSELPSYDLSARLPVLAASEFSEVRAAAFEAARVRRFAGVLDLADKELQVKVSKSAMAAAARYRISATTEGMQDLLGNRDPQVVEAALESLDADASRSAVDVDWIREAAASAEPERRRLAAVAMRVRKSAEENLLYALLADADPRVASAACEAVAAVGDRAYVDAVVRRLGNPRTRRSAKLALISFGPRITGTLGDVLKDRTAPVVVRAQVARVLTSIPGQRGVDVLLNCIDDRHPAVREAVIRALIRIRWKDPAASFQVAESLQKAIRECYELHLAAQPFERYRGEPTPAGLLARTVEARMRLALEKVFRLLELTYEPAEMRAVWEGIRGGRPERKAAAIEYLENVVDHDTRELILPLLDTPEHVAPAARARFGLVSMSPQAAIRYLLGDGDDPWLFTSATAAARQLGLNAVAS